MRELIGFWIVVMTLSVVLTVADAFDDFKAWIGAIATVGTALAMLIIGLYLMGG